jgi:hypothetical protein
MMKQLRPVHAIVVFCLLLGTTAAFSVGQYRLAEDAVLEDLHRALTQTLRQHPHSVVTPDTIRDFRSHLVTPELRATAYLSLNCTKGDADEVQPHYQMQAHAGCSPLMLLAMSDQRGTYCLLGATLLWAVFYLLYMRRHRPSLSMQYVGNLGYDAAGGRFYTSDHQPVPLTPMQRDLMQRFFDAPAHTLYKADICDALWPKKPDASDTLYTLIRRLKTVLRQHSDLDIDSERGLSYQLKTKE